MIKEPRTTYIVCSASRRSKYGPVNKVTIYYNCGNLKAEHTSSHVLECGVVLDTSWNNLIRGEGESVCTYGKSGGSMRSEAGGAIPVSRNSMVKLTSILAWL